MYQEFNYNDNTQITKNVNSKELRCKCGKRHSFKVDLNHIYKEQAFMDKYGYEKVIHTSGFRCEEQNKKVGGAKGSQHLLSCATDCKFYKNGKVVDAKLICCQAQDFGFAGIGYMTNNEVHLDSRASGTYRGDERVNYKSNVGGDFYKYFGIERPKQHYQGEYPVLPNKFLKHSLSKGDKGIEVEKLQKLINWILDDKVVLNDEGKLVPLEIDGKFGKDTKQGVKKYQQRYGLDDDGKFGKNSLTMAETIIK